MEIPQGTLDTLLKEYGAIGVLCLFLVALATYLLVSYWNSINTTKTAAGIVSRLDSLGSTMQKLLTHKEVAEVKEARQNERLSEHDKRHDKTDEILDKHAELHNKYPHEFTAIKEELKKKADK